MKWCLFFLVLSFTPLQGHSKIVEKTVAFIGEEPLLLSELNLFKRHLRANLIPDSLLFKIFPKKTLLKNRSRLVKFMILQKRLYQISSQKGLTISPNHFVQNGKIKLTKNKTNQLSSAEKNLWKKIRAQGLTLEKFWEEVDAYASKNLLLSQEVVSKITISDNEINAYHFNKYGKNLFADFNYEFNSISFSKDKKGARKLRGFLKSLSTSSFDKLIKQKQYKSKLLKLKNTEMNPLMYKTLKKLSVSQVSNPVSINNNFYVLRLKWKTPLLSPSKQKRQMGIQNYLFEIELKKELKKWLAKQEASFPVKIHSR